MTNFRIDLKLDGLEYHFMRVLEDQQDDLRNTIECELSRQIASFNFADAVKQATEDAIKRSVSESVDQFFRFRQGRKAIDKAVQQALLRVTDEEVPNV